MTNVDLISQFDMLPYFTLTGVKQLAGRGEDSNAVLRTLLARWSKAGHIIQLKRGVYMSRRFFELHRADRDFAPAVSAIIFPPSYVSLEYVLQRSGVLAETTYTISAVTDRNTRRVENALGSFVYHHIQPPLYTGFQFFDYYGISFAVASPAKALFDYLYLRPLARPFRKNSIDLAEDLRMNLADFSSASRQEFVQYVTSSRSEKMSAILNNFRSHIWQN